MKLCWLTDIHFNFLNENEIGLFLDKIHKTNPDAILIGGDIGDSNNLVHSLKLFDDRFTVPVHFVLGNHDYYHSSVARVEWGVEEICKESTNLIWLDQSDPIMLGDSISLVGHGSRADGRLGTYDRSNAMLNDYLLIKELSIEVFAWRYYPIWVQTYSK